jgi:hypothetical protein
MFFIYGLLKKAGQKGPTQPRTDSDAVYKN